MKLLPILCFMFIALTATASEKPYDEKANARLEIKEARAQAATAHIPVIALSANAMPRDIEKGLLAGFFRYLTKPIKVNEFMNTLDGALEFARQSAVLAQASVRSS